MEALVAVGLAGNVVQFVQFAGQLISLAKEIKKKGAPSSLLELRKVAEGLAQQTRVIVNRLEANAATLQQEEQYLLDVATDCEKAGEEFIAYIDDLLKISKPNSRLGSIQSSMKIKWHHNHIEAYVSRLNKLQGSLSLATTLSLRTRETSSHQEILEHLRSIQAGNDASQKNNDELMNALRLLPDLVQQQSAPKLNMLQKQMDACIQGIQKVQSSVANSREGEILRWLDFRQRAWRFEEVEEAHQTTFDWIFRKPRHNTPWHDFGAYLSGVDISSPYFINGKAGSGKSTLMKYIVSHPRTTEELQRWAGQHKLFRLQFFFWNVGTELQKSHNGMLRSLLHSILTQYRDLIPAVFPTLYANEIPISNDTPPSTIELKGAFERLKSRSASFLRICIFIDGVDEFDGDHRDMSTFLCFLASPAIKVVVSSRPINACLNVFRNCPTLRLQDLTYNDMRVFIRDRLHSHPMMASLQAESPKKAATLQAEIQGKAEGVFLWVRLVTGLLLQGLDDGDNFEELLLKLRALPNDLRHLYMRMMQKMTPEHQVQASHMFQIFEWWRLHGDGEPLELLLLSSAVEEPSIALNPSTDSWKNNTKKLDFEADASRVRSRCCGLLEVRNTLSASIFWPPTPVVAYLHLSVAEFVMDPDVWKHIISLTSGTKFTPDIHVACGILSILKTSSPLLGETKHQRIPKFSNYTNYSGRILDFAMHVCRRIADIEDSFIIQYMDAIDKAVASTSQELRSNEIDRQDIRLSARWSMMMNFSHERSGSEAQRLARRLRISAETKIPSFAAYNGFVCYLKAMHRNSRLVEVESLILFALSSWRRKMNQLSERRETLSFLLQILGQRSELGIETLVGGKALWELAVLAAYGLSTDHGPEYRHGGSSNTHFTETLVMRKKSIRSTSIRPPSFDTSDSGDTPQSTVYDRTSEATFARDKKRKRELKEHAPGMLDTNFTSNKHRKWENATVRLRHPDYAFRETPTSIPLYHREQSFHQQDLQNAVEILRFFLCATRKQTELLNKAINTSEGLTFTPTALLRELLLWGREEKMGWASEDEYKFLYQLVGLQETC